MSAWWSRTTEHLTEKRLTWACGVLGQVLASGTVERPEQARKLIRIARERWEASNEARRSV